MMAMSVKQPVPLMAPATESPAKRSTAASKAVTKAPARRRRSTAPKKAPEKG